MFYCDYTQLPLMLKIKKKKYIKICNIKDGFINFCFLTKYQLSVVLGLNL